jgi:hypothetical protein
MGQVVLDRPGFDLSELDDDLRESSKEPSGAQSGFRDSSTSNYSLNRDGEQSA